MSLNIAAVIRGVDPDGLVELPAGRGDLARAFKDMGFTKGAEIGVWKGVFSETMCRANPVVQLLCIDPWAPQPDYLEQKNDAAVLHAAFEEARTRLAPYNCEFIRKRGVDAQEDVEDGSLDFVYIDGNHRRDAVLQDLDAWHPKVRRGGIVAGHDFLMRPKRHIEVEHAVRYFVSAYGIRPFFVLRSKDDETPSWFWVKR